MTESDTTTPATAPPIHADPVRIVEAALFSAGKAIDEVEIAENTGLRRDVVRRSLERLAAEYAERDTALEVGKAGAKWAMQVRTTYAPAAVRLAPMEIPVKLLRTLALVAYHQPLLQSDLVDMVGSRVYEHIHELLERGLVRKRPEGLSYMLSTTEAFPEYFGIPATDRDQIRRYLAERVGLVVKPKGDGHGNATLPVDAAGAPEPAPPVDPAPAPEAPKA